MPRMSIDDGLGRDPRLDHLAELCGWTRRETAGCLQLDVWPLCYDRVTPNVPMRDLNTAAARYAVSKILHAGGFTGALIEAELARPATRNDVSFEWVRKGQPNVVLYWHDREWRDRVYIKGAAERIAYLVKSEESGRIGGRNSGKARGKQANLPFRDPEGTLKGPGRDPEGSGNPPDTPTAPDSASALVPDLVLVPDTVPEEAPALRRRAPRSRRPVVQFQSAVDAFHEYFKRTHDGSKPTWTDDNLKTMQTLVKKHGVDEVIRRVGILESHPPSWPPVPWDVRTFSANFDKIASKLANMSGLAFAQAVGTGEIS